MKAILTLDQGTTSSRAILFEQTGELIAVSQREFAQHYPRPGWVEHDANEIWQTQQDVAKEVLQVAGRSASEIAAIGITNQRETTVVWDRVTHEPIGPAIVWQDRRTAEYCGQLRKDGLTGLVESKSGLVVDAYFSASKLKWMLDEIPGARARAERGELAFGTIDSWLVWKLTGGRLHVTDVTNASRTMLFDLQTETWDQELMELFQVPASLLPEVLPSSWLYGETNSSCFGESIPIAGIAGDQQAAMFGQNCVHAGRAKNTYGTGCFMLMNVGEEIARSEHGLLTTPTARYSEERHFALEGSVFVAGAMVQWLRDSLGMIESSAEIEGLARSVSDSDGVVVVPALAGLGAPHWDAFARGTILGLTRGTHRGHIARASLEGIAFQVADVFEAMQADSGASINELRVDGGAAVNDFLMQFQADVMQLKVVRPMVTETTSLGAGFLAGLAVGVWKDVTEIERIWKSESSFEPQMSPEEAARRRSRWREALERCKDWEREPT
ncbi:MAG: glycerol kinase GlpK [Planctomycetota bacterium]